MSIRVAVATLLLAVACGNETGPVGSAPADGASGLELEVVRVSAIATEPLGDVITGELVVGERVTALCFVEHARSNAGVQGSAIKVTSGGVEGFAATSTLHDALSERQSIFDMPTEELRHRLDECSP